MIRLAILSLILAYLLVGCGMGQVDANRVNLAERSPTAGTTSAATSGSAGEPTAEPIPAQTSEPRPTMQAQESGWDVLLTFPETTLRERIAGADVVARVAFQSVGQVVESAPAVRGDDTVYVIALEYRFRVIEYLMGTGADQIVGIASDLLHEYETREQAEASTEDFVSKRDTRWDNREAVVFFKKTLWRIRPHSTDQTGRYVLGVMRHPYPDLDGSYLDSYTISSRVNKGWLPAATTTGGSTYLMDDPASAVSGRAPTITLAALKAEIAAVEAEMAAGGGTEAYRRCIWLKYNWENNEKSVHDANDGWTPRRIEVGSGQAPSASVQYEGIHRGSNVQYWLEGEDAALFAIPSIGRVQAVRPLPAGEYRYVYLDRSPKFNICDAYPEVAKKRFRRIMMAVPPEGVLHELFFDPVTVGNTVAADSANGVLKPESFTDANGASATIESISYEPPAGSDQTGTVKLEVDPHTGLANHVVDFIELDGLVSLSLKVAGATVDSANNTLSWSVSSQPWEDGDKLMVRIREGLPYAPAPQDLSVSLSEGSFTISWSSVAGADQYRVGHRTGGAEGEWTDLDATTGTSQTFSPEGGPACGTTYELRVQARGDGTTYLAGWSAPSEPVSHTTGSCNRAPVFDPSSYSFSVAEDAPAWTTVGIVSATDPDAGDDVVYHITAGNGDGRFNISSGRSGGLILVSDALDYETVSSYTLTVEARDGKAGGTSSATVEISVTNVAEGTPPAPDGLAVSLSGDTFTISWSAVTGAGQYRAQHRTGGSAGTWTSLDATTGTSQAFSPEGGTSCGTTYDFRVQAQGDGETHVVAWGAASEPVSHTTEACNRAPSFGSASYSFPVSEDAATGTAVGTVSATDPDEGDSVAYSITAGNGDAKFSIGGSDGSITVAGSLDYETTLSYTLTVQAIDGDTGAATATVKISVTDVPEAAPPPPTNLTSSYNSAAGSFGFTWHAVAGADVYRVQYRVGRDEGNWTNLEATTSTSHTFRPAGGPLCGTTYKFQIQARGDGETYPANWSSGSGSVTYNTPACNVAESPPPAPQNLAATATHNSVTLSWTAPDDSTVTGYQVLRRRPNHGETGLLVHVSDTGSTATTYTDSAVQASTRYVYRVKAINAAGVGPFSNRVTATTAAQP